MTDTPHEPDPAPTSAPTASRKTLRIGLVAVVTLVAFESLAVITVLPEIEDDLGGVEWYGWVTTAFFLGTMLGIVAAGEQADRRGAGRPYVIGLVLFAAGLVIGGLAPSMPVLVAGRLVQGFGAGVVPAIGYIAIGRAFAPEERPRMFALLSTAWVVPGVVGPVIAERVAAAVGWRWVFLALIPLVAVAGSFVVPAIRTLGPSAAAPSGGDGESTPFVRRRMVEAVRVAAGAALIVAALEERGWVLVPGIAAGVLVGIGSLRRLAPAGTLHAARGLPAAVLSRGLLTFAFFGTDTFVPYAITDGRGHSTFSGSVVVTTATLTWTIGTWSQERYITRTGERFFVRAGFCVITVGVLIVALSAMPDVVPFWGIHVGWTLGGLGMGLAYAAHSQQVLRLAPTGGDGAATASLQLFDNLGIALGTGAVGVVVSYGDTSGWAAGDAVALAVLLSAAVAAAGVFVARRLDGGRASARDHGAPVRQVSV